MEIIMWILDIANFPYTWKTLFHQIDKRFGTIYGKLHYP